MAYAGYRFVDRLIDAAFKGVSDVVEPSYVYVAGDAVQKEIGEIDFFSVPVQLGVSSSLFQTESVLLRLVLTEPTSVM